METNEKTNKMKLRNKMFKTYNKKWKNVEAESGRQLFDNNLIENVNILQ